MSWPIDFTKMQFTFASVTGEIIPSEKSDETIAQGPSGGVKINNRWPYFCDSCKTLLCYFTVKAAVKCVIEKCYSGLPKARLWECVHLGVLITWFILSQTRTCTEKHTRPREAGGWGRCQSLLYLVRIDFTQLPDIAKGGEGEEGRGRPAKCLEKHFSSVKCDTSIASSAKQLRFSHRVWHQNLDAHQLFQSGKWKD